ncbi:MAG: hypothetical protein HZB92_01240 [Euryarchaeota archaeon]|nr:hypothetical protein [Euryarchaeota archaeon]
MKIVIDKEEMEISREEIEEHIQELQKLQQQALLKGYTRAAERYRQIIARLLAVRDFFDSNLDAESSETDKAMRYVFSSERLTGFYRYLMTDGENEKYCYGTGIIDNANNNVVVTNILTPKMSEQSPVSVRGDVDSIREVLTYLSQFDHTIVVQCHKHPGYGASSTQPSGIDIRNHRDWESYYPLIGVIFVRNGFFRFFSAGK